MSASPWSNLDQADVTALLTGANYVQNELIVALKNTATTFADVLAVESARDATTTTAIAAQKLLGTAAFGGSTLYQLTLDAGANFADTLAAISNWTSVEWVTPNFVDTAGGPEAEPTDPSLTSIAAQPIFEDTSTAALAVSDTDPDNVLPPGTLDTSFGADGFTRLVSPFGTSEVVRDVALRPDGKYVVLAGPTGTDPTSLLLLYNSDGTLDTSWGNKGQVGFPSVPFSTLGRFSSVAVAADGTILVAGFQSQMITVLRFLPDATLDASFGVAGTATFTPTNALTTSTQFPTAMALAADGKIVLAQSYRGLTGQSDTLVARLTTTGALDTTFNGSGYGTIAVNSGDDAPYDVTVQADGKIVVVGVSGSTSSDFYAVRITATGGMDSAFGTGGVVTVNMGATDLATRVVLQSDGKIVIGGTTNLDFGLLRLNTNGTLDSTFGVSGKVITNIAGTDQLLGLAVRPDGRIVAAGSATVSGTGVDFALARYTAAGVLDPTFDGDGKRTIAAGSSFDVVNVLLVQPDGKLFFGGYTTTADGPSDLALGRLLADGAADATFATGGFAYHNLDQASSTASATLVLPDGRILVAGTTGADAIAIGGRWTISRLWADGRLDTTFGTGGYAAGAVGSNFTVVGLARQSDRKILLLTTTSIVRLTADGVLDAGFGTAGSITLSSYATATAIEVATDDSILIAGYKTNSATGYQEFAVLRLLAAGAFDTSFSGDGVATVDVGARSDQGLALAIQSDGKILIAGQADNGVNNDFGLIRLNADGSLDTTFSVDGILMTPMGTGIDFARSVAVQADGKIVVGGTSNGDFALARYAADGTLDTTFAGDGTLVLVNPMDTEEIHSLFARPDGKLVAVGVRRSSAGTTHRLAALQFLADGSLDPSFTGDPNSDGVVTMSTATTAAALVVDAALEPDGKLIVVGRAAHQNGRSDAAVFRLLLDHEPAGSVPTITPVGDPVIDEGGSFSFTFTVADADTSLDRLRVSVAGSDRSLFAAENSTLVHLGGGVWSFSAVARPGQFGESVVTISVSDGVSTVREQARLTVLAVNDAPTFFKGTSVVGAAGKPTTISGWAKQIFAGSPDEYLQALSFEVVAADPSLFDLAPAIAADGTLTFSAKASAAGLSTLVTVRLRDDGGTDRGGVDVSASETFTIQIRHAPVITVSDQTVLEGGEAEINFSVSDADSPSGSLIVRGSAGDSSLLSNVSVATLGSGNYKLFGTIAADVFGMVQIFVTASDGFHTTTRSFLLNVVNVNDAPSFAKGLDQYAGAGPQTVGNWASSITAGARESSSQNLTFVVSVDDPSLFAMLPTISAEGTLAYTAAAGKSGIARVTVRLEDDGGTADGGVNASPEQSFVIRVLTSVSTAGDFDAGFHGDGVVDSPSLQSSAGGRDVAVQADGKVIVVGVESPGVFGAAFVARYLVDGTLDASFGVGGIVRIDPGLVIESAPAVKIAADGKIYVAFNNGTDFNVARLNIDGSFDASFGNGGIAVAAAATTDITTGIALQQDGKIVVVGSSNNDLAATRFNVDGTVDFTFGIDGYFRQSIGSSTGERLYDVAVQNDGRIVATGTGSVTDAATTNDVVVLRLTRDGRLDTSFSGDGILTAAGTGTASAFDQGNRIALDGNDRLIVAGISNSRAMLLRLNADGTFDHTFDGDGWVTSAFGTTESLYALAVQSDGRILVGGWVTTSSLHMALARFNVDGSFDLSFNATGRAIVSVGDTQDLAFALALDADGKIVVAGQAGESGNQAIAVVRLLANGTPDRSFSGDGGQTTTLAAVSQQFSSVVSLPDGRYLVGGQNYRNGSAAIVVARYLADGTLDTSFGSDGFAYPASAAGSFGLALQADGKIVGVAVGSSGGSLYRLNADGTLDTTFAGDGSASLPSGFTSYAVAFQFDGKVVVAGQLSSNFAVARYSADGTLDLTFSTDGYHSFDTGVAEAAHALAILPDGRIVLAGYASGGNTDFLAARLNADGTLDTTFAGDGWVRTAVGTGSDQATSLVVQADGRIVLGGTTDGWSGKPSPTGVDWGFVRYNVNGSLDASFDGDGIMTFAPGVGDDTFGALRLQADGRLVAVGSTPNGLATDTIVARFLSSGRLDPTFAEDGLLLAPLSAGADGANGLTIDPDGKIVIAGYAAVNGRYEGRIVRLLNDVDRAPAVAGVYVRGSAWSPQFVANLDANGQGNAETAGLGFALAGGSSQLAVTIPWSNVDRITVRFDRDVVASIGSLTLYNSSGQGVSALGFRYIDGRTVEWVVPTLASNKYLINLDAAMLGGIADLALDGEWNTSETNWLAGSGDGTAGGSFDFRFNVLPGDFDSSGSVAFGELGQARLKIGITTSSTGYLYRQDYDGSGSITFGDFGQARGRLGTGISAFADPPPPPDSLEFQNAYDRNIIAEPREGVQDFVPPSIETPAEPDPFDAQSELSVDDALEFVSWETATATEDLAAKTSELTEGFLAGPEFVVSPLFFEPAEVVDRLLMQPVFPPSPAWVRATGPRATFDMPGARFDGSPLGRSPAIERSAVVTSVRAHAFTTVRSEVRPDFRQADLPGDEPAASPLSHPFIAAAHADAPRGWHRLRRRSDTTDAGNPAESLLATSTPSRE